MVEEGFNGQSWTNPDRKYFGLEFTLIAVVLQLSPDVAIWMSFQKVTWDCHRRNATDLERFGRIFDLDKSNTLP